MRSLQMQGIVTALSSISHNGGETLGITSQFRREKFVQLDGSVEEIPVVSGNGLRGMLRDRGMMHMCRALGYGVSDSDVTVKGLSLAAFYFLFSGGSLTKEGGRAISIQEAEELRALIPLVSVFGGANGNSMLPGKLKCGKLIPVCSETAHLLPSEYVPEKPTSFYEYLQEEMYTRKDDAKNLQYQPLITSSSGQPKLIKTSEKEPKDAPQQMMYYVQSLAAGTRFYWKVVLDDVTDVEFESFIITLTEFGRMPYIGGKSNVGHGEVSVKLDNWIEIDSRALTTGQEIGQPLGHAYMQHLSTRGAEIKARLAEMK